MKETLIIHLDPGNYDESCKQLCFAMQRQIESTGDHKVAAEAVTTTMLMYISIIVHQLGFIPEKNWPAYVTEIMQEFSITLGKSITTYSKEKNNG